MHVILSVPLSTVNNAMMGAIVLSWTASHNRDC